MNNQMRELLEAIDRKAEAGLELIAIAEKSLAAPTVAGAVLSEQQIDDMAFGYAPSGKIGELREFARAILSAAAAQPAQEPVAKQPTNGEPEAHKLARILMGMVAGVEDYTPTEIYRDGYSCSDGDVFVHRAADLLAEQAAEIAELVRHIDNITNIYAAAQAINQADSARLDFVLDKQAVILTIDKDMHQLMVQDWDDDYYVISGEGQAFRTRREAIDAAMEIDAASTTTGDAAIGEKGNG